MEIKMTGWLAAKSPDHESEYVTSVPFESIKTR